MSDTRGLSVDLRIDQGDFKLQIKFVVSQEILVLFGPSGVGKTKTLESIAGLYHPQQGEITIDGTPLFRRGGEGKEINIPPRKRRIGFVFQDYALFPHLTALRNVSFANRRDPDAIEHARGLFKRLGIAGLENRYPGQLSGGQQQRVAVARALASGPRALLLDEPFSALDLESRLQVRQEILEILRGTVMPVVLVTHDREEAIALGDRTIVLDQGRVVAEGKPTSILGNRTLGQKEPPIAFDNVFNGFVTVADRNACVTTCTIGGGLTIEAPYHDARPGDRVRIGIRAGDILIATVRPNSISARNIIPGKVTAVREREFEREVLVETIAEMSGNVTATFHVEVTPKAVDSLGLAPDKNVWLLINSNSCLILS